MPILFGYFKSWFLSAVSAYYYLKWFTKKNLKQGNERHHLHYKGLLNLSVFIGLWRCCCMFVCFLWKNKCAHDAGSLFDLLWPWLLFFYPSFTQFHHFLLHTQLHTLVMLDINELCWRWGAEEMGFMAIFSHRLQYGAMVTSSCWPILKLDLQEIPFQQLRGHSLSSCGT